MGAFTDPRDERDLASVLSRRVARSPDKPWLVTDAGRYTYGDIDTRSGRLAGGFARAGVAAGDTVLLMLPDTVDYICLWCALAKIGAIEVPVNVHHRGSILTYLINDSQAEVLVVDAQYLERIEAVADDLATLKRIYVVGAADHALDAGAELIDWRELSSSGRTWAGEGPSYVDLMAVMYTSGTTGPSKGATITHAHAYQYAHGVVRMLDLNESDVYYAPLPLFHIAGQFALVYTACIAGATAVLPGTFSARRFWRDVRRHKATATFLLGAMANFLYRQDPAEDDADNPLERVLMVPLIPETEEFKTRFDCMVSTTWGGTEMNCPVRSGFDLVDNRSCGRLVEDLYEVRIADDRDRELPPGVPGEALVRAKGAVDHLQRLLEPSRLDRDGVAEPVVSHRRHADAGRSRKLLLRRSIQGRHTAARGEHLLHGGRERDQRPSGRPGVRGHPGGIRSHGAGGHGRGRRQTGPCRRSGGPDPVPRAAHGLLHGAEVHRRRCRAAENAHRQDTEVPAARDGRDIDDVGPRGRRSAAPALVGGSG